MKPEGLLHFFFGPKKSKYLVDDAKDSGEERVLASEETGPLRSEQQQ